MTEFDLISVPPHHLHHLIDQALERNSITAELADKLRAYANNRDIEERRKLIEQLTPTFPGLPDRLSSLWGPSRGTTVHLVQSPALTEYKPADLAAELYRRAGHSRVSLGEIVKPKKPALGDGVRLTRIAATHDVVEATLAVDKQFSFIKGEERRYETRTLSVDLRVNSARTDRLMEVYAEYGLARAALFAFLGFACGVPVPRRKGSSQEQFFLPVVYTEASVKKLMQQLKGRSTDVKGPDGSNKNLEATAFWSTRDETTGKLLPLDTSDARVAAQDKQKNVARGVAIDFVHGADGFEEEVEAQFRFGGTWPRVGFRGRTSEAGKRHLLDALIRLSTGI